MVNTLNQYEALLASKDTMLTKYVEALTEKNNTIEYLKSLLALRDHKIETLKEELVFTKGSTDNFSSIPDMETEHFVSNEVIMSDDDDKVSFMDKQTSASSIEVIATNENIPMELVWKEVGLEVVGSLKTSEYNFSVIDPPLDSTNEFQNTINHKTNNIPFHTKEENKLNTKTYKELFLEWKEKNEYFKQTGKKKALPCPSADCSKIFSDGASYRKHRVTHGPKMFVCKECQKAFKENSKLIRHMVVHTGEQFYKCSFDMCGKSFSLEFNLRTHIRIHTGERPYRCHVLGCGQNFTQKCNLNSHVLTHQNPKIKRKHINGGCVCIKCV